MLRVKWVRAPDLPSFIALIQCSISSTVTSVSKDFLKGQKCQWFHFDTFACRSSLVGFESVLIPVFKKTISVLNDLPLMPGLAPYLTHIVQLCLCFALPNVKLTFSWPSCIFPQRFRINDSNHFILWLLPSWFFKRWSIITYDLIFLRNFIHFVIQHYSFSWRPKSKLELMISLDTQYCIHTTQVSAYW